MSQGEKSSTQYILEALIPYSKANMQLAFKPSRFFAELERLDRVKEQTAKTSFYRAVRKGLVELDDQGIPRLTNKGNRRVLPFSAPKLKGAHLMIVFDIPEVDRWKRGHLRTLLLELSFKQVQKSVWTSQYDHRELLKMEIEELGLGKEIRLFEARDLLK
jgi:DNA-binding transcriptional regulator PaaX